MLKFKTILKPFVMIFVLASIYSANASAEGQFLRSAFELEDPSGYCLDIPGFGPRMRKDAPITTHTCKYSRPGFSVDEEFEMTTNQQLRLPEYDLCLSAKPAAGADVYTLKCVNETAQQWQVSDNGQVTPASDEQLCLTLSTAKEYVNTSPGNLVPNSSRAISLQKCGSTAPRYQTWKWSDTHAQPTPSANTLRDGMPPTIGEKLKEMGAQINPVDTAARNIDTAALYVDTAALYKDQPRMFSKDDVMILEETQYGSSKSHRLQVYTGKNRNNPRNAAPVLMLVHGGGFARGGLQDMKLPAIHFAALGYVVVNTTYPLLPEAKWPSGGQSIAAAVNWVKKNAEELKANPDQIFILGTSAGGANLAEFVFRSSILEGEMPTIAGAILSSPAGLKLSAKAPESIVAYYGEDQSLWVNKQTIGNLERTSIPVLLAVAEHDPRNLQVATAQLYSDLLKREDVSPRLTQLRGHNHTSYIHAIGTSDNQFTEEILDFMATTK